MAKWVKTTPYGDYRDPLQNHKFDGDLHFKNRKCEELKVITRLSNILHEARWYFGKHIGSKRLANVIALNRKANSKRHLIKEYVNNSKRKAENTSEETGK